MLQTIIDHKVQELETRRRARPLTALRDAPLFAAARRDFAAALRAPGRRIIAEVKRASPSRGRICEDFDPVAIAAGYAAAGAAAVSVLTDERFFEGSLDDLTAVRERITIPVLRKDFLFEPYHLYEARAAGADAFLLIAAILTAEHLRELVALGAELGMTALVEVHTVEQIERARGAGVQVWGINNRDLDTLEVQLETGLELLRLLPADATVVIESGLRTRDDLARFEAAGVRAFLVGETLMRAPDPAAALRTLLQ
ncbi:MAG: indole-3-glycerol phosphate synthase TrpC [Deltaproteobacteria bacterium]|nr:MAG: indole-3-glycerol phosphate synthase TrpC [Deltaproteobacteria bacterium]